MTMPSMPTPLPPSTWRLLTTATLVLATALSAQAQNTDKPKPIKLASTDPNLALVPQTGQKADQLREYLKRVNLPPGFRIDLYAVVPDARHMALAPSGKRLFVGTRKATVWAITQRNSGNTTAEVKPFAPALKFSNPNGVCWSKDGALIVAERNRVRRFPAAELFDDQPDTSVIDVVGQGKLVPPDEESHGHGARTCRVGPDGLLYITLGQPYNVQPRAKVALYNQLGMGGIVRMNALDGSQREVFATGLRNSVGQDFNPKDGSLWFTDNQTDGMGDDIPAGEINRADKPGMFFGYPYIQGKTRITEFGYDKDPLPANTTAAEVFMEAHAADLGMCFYTGQQFPAKYQGAIFSAQHGSWNRSQPIGARVMVTYLTPHGHADKTEVFADGWLDSDTGTYRGRPVDVAVMKDGSLLVSDDYAGALYRIRYAGSAR